MVEMKDWEVQSERADQKQHGKHGFQVGSIPHIAKTLGEAPLGSESSIPRMKLIEAKETQRAEHGSKRGGADQEHPAGARGSDEDAGHARADHPCNVEGGGIQCHCV